MLAMPSQLALAVAAFATLAASAEHSLWERMGGESKIKPLCNDLYDRHASDPLTAEWFEPSSQWNERTAAEVKQHVFHFFSAGIGGPHKYEGRDMVTVHAKMAKMKPITEAAFHALSYHVLEQMERHGAGGSAEKDEVLAILMSLKADVTKHGMKKFEPSEESLYDRMGMGDEAIIRPLSNELYDFHVSDPLTAPWFALPSGWNERTATQVKEHVFNFFSSGIGRPHEYIGRDMITAYAKMRNMKPITETAFHSLALHVALITAEAKMRKMKPITETAFHALVFHVMAMMKKHKAGGEREMDEVFGILQSLKPHVMEGHSGQDTMLRSAVLGTVIASVSVLLLAWRWHMAMDSSINNWGIFQWSPMFYQKVGPVMDFINALPYAMNLAPTATVFLGIYLRELYGNDWLTYITFFVGFVGVPIVDLFVGEDSYNPTPEEEAALRQNKWFSFHLCAYVWVYMASVVAVAYYVGVESGFVHGGENRLSLTALIGISTSMGISSGFGIGCIHELIHRPSWVELWHGRAVLVFSNYNHFWIEHLFGHHKRVATDEDPACSALNESLWCFMPKCWLYSFISALRLEEKYQRARGRGFFCIENRILSAYFISWAIDLAILHLCGPQALAFMAMQSILTAFLTDSANYIEHYGLRRRRLSDKTDEWGWRSDYEAPAWMHSWNSGDRITNWILFKIQRHPDHHVNAGRPYQILRTLKESPTYPTGYAGMFVLSWFPPLWFMVMNPLVKKAEEDYAQMLRKGTYDRHFPKGVNNISSVYKTTGEDFFRPGSSEYAGGVDASPAAAQTCDEHPSRSESEPSKGPRARVGFKAKET